MRRTSPPQCTISLYFYGIHSLVYMRNITSHFRMTHMGICSRCLGPSNVLMSLLSHMILTFHRSLKLWLYWKRGKARVLLLLMEVVTLYTNGVLKSHNNCMGCLSSWTTIWLRLVESLISMRFYRPTLSNGTAFVIRSLSRSLAIVLRWLRRDAYRLERRNVGPLTRARIAPLGDIW